MFSQKMVMILFATFCLSFMTIQASTTKIMETEITRMHPEEDNFNDFEQDYQDEIIENEDSENLETTKRKVDTNGMIRNAVKREDAGTQMNKLNVKRQDGRAGLWGRRQISDHIPPHREDSDVEILREAIRMALQGTKVSRKRLMYKRDHGSTGLWGRRNVMRQRSLNLPHPDNYLWQEEEDSFDKRRLAKGPSEKTGLWGRRRSMRKSNDLSRNNVIEEQKRRLGLMKEKSNQPPDIGLWGGKRSVKPKDPTKGPSDGDEVGLWGKRQHGKAGLWGKKRSLKNIVTIF